MDVKELSKFLTVSATRLNQSKFIPWWEEDFENSIYYYNLITEEEIAEAQECLAQCSKETLLAPTGIYGGYGLTLFHLLVWHNFYDAIKAMFDDGRISDEDVNLTDDKGYGLTPILLACCRGNLAMTKLLLDHGADASLSDKRGMNAFHFLAYPQFEGLNDPCQEKTAMQREAIARILTCDINQKDAEGFTPLSRLLTSSYCSEYTWPLTEVFLDKGAETDYIDQNGNSLLMLAMKNGHITAALQLMKRHPEMVEMANKEGVTPIRHAHEWRNDGLCLALADYGATPIDTAPMDISELSQITSNAFCNHSHDDLDGISLALFLTEKLIAQVDMDDDDELGYVTDIFHNALLSDPGFRVLDACHNAGLDFTMPIHFGGSITCLRDECLGTCYGANVIRKMIDLGVDMDSGVIKGLTPAYIIASKDPGSRIYQDCVNYHREAAKILSKQSMEQLNESGKAAIHMAARNGHADMLAVMIEKGIDVNLSEDSPADPGTTPLHEACTYGHVDVVKLLMDVGADDTIKNSKGETPAHCVVSSDRYSREMTNEKRGLVLKLLKNLDIPDQNGRTPLMLLQLADLTAPKELFPIFAEKGVDVNHTDNLGMTALMLNADHYCFKDAIKQLIQAGADIHITDNEGNTVLYYALQNGDSGVARYLIKKGANYNQPNNEGITPVQVAVEHGLDTVLELMTDIE
ncbi:ankyrin repeat domain-containing protein [Lachnospiraceae bacterium JLR.KK008]